MLIQHKEDGHKGTFYIEIGGEELAEMTYSLTDSNIMIIDHTAVDDSLRGKNIGAQLVQSGADYARSKNLTIIPLCSFAKAFFDKERHNYQDILCT